MTFYRNGCPDCENGIMHIHEDSNLITRRSGPNGDRDLKGHPIMPIHDDNPDMIVRHVVEWSHTSATHETTVTRTTGSLDAYYFVGIDCIDTEGTHVRASVISRHDEREAAIRAASRLVDIVGWAR